MQNSKFDAEDIIKEQRTLMHQLFMFYAICLPSFYPDFYFSMYRKILSNIVSKIVLQRESMI